MPSLIIEGPPFLFFFFTFWPLYDKLVVTYVSTVMRSAFSDILVPQVTVDLTHLFIFLIFLILTRKINIGLLPYGHVN